MALPIRRGRPVGEVDSLTSRQMKRRAAELVGQVADQKIRQALAFLASQIEEGYDRRKV
jgi:hypothetical protein